MKLSLKSAVAASVLALASTSALALEDSYAPNGSSVAFIAYNNNFSYVLDLGETFDSMLSSIQGLSAGESLTFELPNFGTTYGSPAPDAPLNWGVLAGNSNFFNVLVTSPTDIVIDDGQVSSITDGSIITFYGRTNVGCGGAPAGTACVAAPTIDHWGGEPSDGLDTTYFGAQMLDQVRTWGFVASELGQALSFYHLTLDDFDESTDESTALGDWRVYYSAAANNWVAEFAVAPVPLPAAVWMLLSGLMGLGFVSRRKPQ